MSEIVRRMTDEYDAKHVARLLPALRQATSKQAQAIWREAGQLGITEALERAYKS